MEVFTAIIVFIFGLVFGSFYNVVIYRLPRGLPLGNSRSVCPQCGHKLSALELVPLLSFLWLKRRCSACSGPISWRYFLVELATGLAFLFLFLFRPFSYFIIGSLFFSLLLILALIDLEHKILPNILTLPGLGLGLMLSLFGFSIPFKESAIGALLGFLVIFLIILISRGGMGMGDAKLMAMIGSFLGWKGVFFVLVLGSFIGAVSGIIYLYVTKQGRKTPIPFGPSLALAAFIIYLWGLW